MKKDTDDLKQRLDEIVQELEAKNKLLLTVDEFRYCDCFYNYHMLYNMAISDMSVEYIYDRVSKELLGGIEITHIDKDYILLDILKNINIDDCGLDDYDVDCTIKITKKEFIYDDAGNSILVNDFFRMGIDPIPDWFMDKVSSSEITLYRVESTNPYDDRTYARITEGNIVKDTICYNDIVFNIGGKIEHEHLPNIFINKQGEIIE